MNKEYIFQFFVFKKRPVIYYVSACEVEEKYDEKKTNVHYSGLGNKGLNDEEFEEQIKTLIPIILIYADVLCEDDCFGLYYIGSSEDEVSRLLNLPGVKIVGDSLIEKRNEVLSLQRTRRRQYNILVPKLYSFSSELKQALIGADTFTLYPKEYFLEYVIKQKYVEKFSEKLLQSITTKLFKKLPRPSWKIFIEDSCDDAILAKAQIRNDLQLDAIKRSVDSFVRTHKNYKFLW